MAADWWAFAGIVIHGAFVVWRHANFQYGARMKGRPPTTSAPTETDVAKLAGVSQSAVSRAFTPGASVSPATRQKIIKAAQRLGYHPNLIARSLSTKRSNIVGLAIGNLENPFYAGLLKDLSEQLSATDRHILMFAVTADETSDPRIGGFLSYQIDALIVTGTSPSRNVANRYRRSGVPVVLINRATRLAGINTVLGENRHAGETVAAFLMAAGHRRFAYIGGIETSTVSREREAGYREFIESRTDSEVLVRHGDYTFQGAAVAARSLLALDERPDAIFCASDYMAFAAIDVTRREFNLVPGRDLSIVGFDDVAEASYTRYDLTTFSQPPAALAREAIAIVDSHVANGQRRAEHRLVTGELVVRGSARVPAEGVVIRKGVRIWSL
ncbi:MAG: LacI family DNA-binding transcriptional regulator [Bauldia sp.]